jgi:tRNA A-37 threonylcarbamoyl transferase component Bud32
MATEDVFGIVGTVVAGCYRVEQVVAHGGFAVVYRAYHDGFRAPVALKCLRIPQQLRADGQQEFLEQFQAEAQLLFRLSAAIPTVVRPLGIDAVTTQKGELMPFMALEWLQGETLESVAARRRAAGEAMGLPELVQLLTPVARALEKAHKFVGPAGPVSIVHRDLKPENIFVATVAGEQTVKILDFGIGKAKSVASQVAGRLSQTPDATLAFTPAYAAPEQWMPKRFGQTGPWTDVWGLALTMVELLAGRSVIQGDHAAMMGTAIDPARRPTPRAEGVVVSDQVESVFRRALALDPRQRHPDAGAFWGELSEALSARVAGGAAQPGRAAAPGAAADVIPDLEVEAAVSRKPATAAQTPMSVMDMDEFGVEHQNLELALDLGEDQSVSQGVAEVDRSTRGAGSDATQPEAAARVGEEAAAAPPGSAPDRAATRASATDLWERVVELVRGVWDEDAPLGLQLVPGIALIGLALLVTVVDQVYVAATDEVLALGPIRPGWFAGLFLLGGIGLVAYRIFLRYR